MGELPEGSVDDAVVAEPGDGVGPALDVSEPAVGGAQLGGEQEVGARRRRHEVEASDTGDVAADGRPHVARCHHLDQVDGEPQRYGSGGWTEQLQR